MSARRASVCWCVLLCWCAGVSAICVLPHFTLNVSYDGTWKHKMDFNQLQDRMWNFSIQNTSSVINGDPAFLITLHLTAPATGNDCPAGKFYKVHSDRQTWGDAMEACEQEDAHLAVIDSHKEAVDLIELIEKAETTKWVHWIGFHDHFREGEYTTVFNKKMEYKGWAPGEPGNSPTLNCGFFYFANVTHYGMADGNCKQQYRYICERSTSALGYESASRKYNPLADVENYSNVSQDQPSTQANATLSGKNQTEKNTSPNKGNNGTLNQSPAANHVKNKSLTVNHVTNQSPAVNHVKNQSPAVHNLSNEPPKPQKEPSKGTDEIQATSAADVEDNPRDKWREDPMSGYMHIPGFGHYRLHDISERNNWHAAHAICAREGAHLLILNSEDEEQAIKELIDRKRSRGRLHWVGFHDQYRERKYVTVCNDSMTYTNWYPGRPEGTKQFNCGYYLYHNATHNGLADGDCTWPGPFICEDESVKKRPALPQSGYLKAPVNMGYYKKFGEAKSFHDAMKACEADGSHLIIINNELEARFMMALAGKGSHWVGIHDIYNEGKYVTVFNDTMKSTGYSRWYPGDPNDVEWIDEDCIAFTYQSKVRRGYTDLSCEQKLPFVCEFELVQCVHSS